MVPEGAESISDEGKVRIVSDFIHLSPPGEFNEIFNDVRILTNNDVLFKEGISKALSKYNKDQLTPVRIECSAHQVLLTEHNDLGGCRFYDPRSKKSFKYDHLRMEACEFKDYEVDSDVESWRLAIEIELDQYLLKHYATGVSSVFGKKDGDTIVIIACVESHNFQSVKYFNGRFRSQWIVTVRNDQINIRGILRVQIHYFEDGNVQLMSSKEIQAEELERSTEEVTAQEIIKRIEEEENTYQNAIYESYQKMSTTTFKALRRQLPVTRTKIDWSKIMSYKVSKELKTQ